MVGHCAGAATVNGGGDDLAVELGVGEVQKGDSEEEAIEGGLEYGLGWVGLSDPEDLRDVVRSGR